MISGNDKNKQVTILSHCKLAFTRRNTVCKWLCKFRGTSKQKYKTRRDAFSGLDLSILCHQRPNPVRETVPGFFFFFYLLVVLLRTEGGLEDESEVPAVEKDVTTFVPELVRLEQLEKKLSIPVAEK